MLVIVLNTILHSNDYSIAKYSMRSCMLRSTRIEVAVLVYTLIMVLMKCFQLNSWLEEIQVWGRILVERGTTFVAT